MNYYRDLIKELNFDYLPREKQEELTNNMDGIIYDRIILKILGMITNEEAVILTRLLEEKKEQEAREFLIERIPEFDNMLKKEIMDFQEEIIQVVK